MAVVARTVPLVLVALLGVRPARAEVAIPELSGPVIDAGNFFSAAEAKQLGDRCRDLRARGGPAFQVWTVPTLDGEPIESVSIRAVEQWKLCREGKDDGLLLMIARLLMLVAGLDRRRV